jgi:hypothetical protein
MATLSTCENEPMELVGYYGVYAVSCTRCGGANRFARAEGSVLKAGETVLDFCWYCLDHVDHIVVPNGCLVVWKDKRLKRRRTV